MRAQVFSLKHQDVLRQSIEESLGDNLYSRIRVEHSVFDDDNEKASVGLGESYLRRLRASMVRTDDFSLEVQNALGNWGYWGYTGEKGGAYFVRLQGRVRQRVFPSVAVMDRMVMVPHDIHDAFDAPTGFSYLLRPLDLRGVLLVDFENREAVREAVATIAGQLRKEIANLGRRHMSVRRITAPDLVDLSELLHVDKDFLEGLREEILRPLPQLVPKVISEPARLGMKSQVALEIRSESEEPLGIVRAQIRAPWRVMRTTFAQYLDFSEARCQVIQFEVKPRSRPYCPIEVLFLFDQVAQASTSPIPLILDVR